MKVSFILLAHEPPNVLRGLIRTLLTYGSDVYVHYDLRSTHDLQKISAEWNLETLPGRIFHAPRVSVKWGEWSVVEGTLNCLRLAIENNHNSDYFMLISGSCMPTRPLNDLYNFLNKNSDFDFIETVNILEKIWVKQGIQKERWSKYHFINWRDNPYLFDLSLKIQDKFRIKRRIPLKHVPHMGSQWWCLRSSTIQSILKLIDEFPRLKRFYKFTWVPDELFFQTLVANIIPRNQIFSQQLTFYKFNSFGVAKTFYNDDFPIILDNYFFLRKISHRAEHLRKKLSNVALMTKQEYRKLIDHEKSKLDKVNAFKTHIKLSEWYAIATSTTNKYEYVQSIPNPIICVYSSNATLRKMIFDYYVNFNNFIPVTELITSPKTMDTFPFILGKYAFLNPTKTLIFTCKANNLSILEILKWKINVGIIFVDDITISNPCFELSKEAIPHLLCADTRKNFLDITSKRKCQIYTIKFDNNENYDDQLIFGKLELFNSLLKNLSINY